ncbi:MAG TPA: adenosylcobinamide amidohydrolase [Kofleriaceae bacterium]|nr:adenosylcobinamide amidohydrolase [Kofleriaceae bacterium]
MTTAAMTVQLAPRLLVVRFAEPQRVVSWAMLGGGLGRTRAVAWVEVRNDELRPPVDPCELARTRLEAAGIADAVTLMTSRDLRPYVDLERTYRDVSCRCIATVGLGNALRAGDPPGPDGRIGTINVLCCVSVGLTDEALLEALALASEARSLAVREAEVASPISGLPASGTGTDCIVIAAPDTADPHRFAGKHTELGHVVGAAVHDAVRSGAEQWKCEQAAARAMERNR